jgi:hypothetical protein
MSAFWETLQTAAAAAIATMGESVTLDGAELSAIVDPLNYEDAMAAGGRKVILNCRVMVPGTLVPRDGMVAVIRGAEGKVSSWETLAPDGTRWLSVGSANRWSGEIPGV